MALLTYPALPRAMARSDVPSAIYWAHLDRIYYANDRKDAAKIGFDDEFIYEEIDRKIEDRHKPMIALMRDEALGAFRMWEENTEKTEY